VSVATEANKLAVLLLQARKYGEYNKLKEAIEKASPAALVRLARDAMLYSILNSPLMFCREWREAAEIASYIAHAYYANDYKIDDNIIEMAEVFRRYLLDGINNCFLKH